MTQEQLKTLQERFLVLASDAKYIKDGMDELSEWNSLSEFVGNLGKFYDFCTRCVLVMEATAKDLVALQVEVQGEDKRAALASAIDAMVVLPAYLEPFDGLVIKLAIDFAVRSLNDRIGHDWGAGKILEWVQKGRDLLEYAGSFLK